MDSGSDLNHHRRSIRMPGYDYSEAGAYFITLVSRGRECLFGEIRDGEMRLSDMGQVAGENWVAIPDHFPNAELGVWVVMPNHLHGIIILGEPVWATHWVAPTKPAASPRPRGPKRGSIGAIISAYKMAVTRRVGGEMNGGTVWQRNYYEHIIRDEGEWDRIHRYIEANTANWGTDSENPFMLENEPQDHG